MGHKNHIKTFFSRWLSLPSVRSFIVVVGILVAMLIGVFTLNATSDPSAYSAIIPDVNDNKAALYVDAENIEVSSSPFVIVYDKNFDLIIATDLANISPYEKEHLNRLLNICELLIQNEETTIYWLDK